MVFKMARDYVCHSADADPVAAGGTDAFPGIVAEIFEHRQMRLSQRCEFVYQICETAFIRIGIGNVVILLKTWQGSLVISCKSQRAVSHYPFAITEMTDDLF